MQRKCEESIIVILSVVAFESLGLCQQVSYQYGLRAALEKSDIKRCDRITEAIPLSDVGPSLATTRLTCKIQFGMARKDPNVCEQLANGPDMSAGRFAIVDLPNRFVAPNSANAFRRKPPLET